MLAVSQSAVAFENRQAEPTFLGMMCRMNSPNLSEPRELRLIIAGEFRLMASDRPVFEQGLLAAADDE